MRVGLSPVDVTGWGGDDAIVNLVLRQLWKFGYEPEVLTTDGDAQAVAWASGS
jgi:hypothetical protein